MGSSLLNFLLLLMKKTSKLPPNPLMTPKTSRKIGKNSAEVKIEPTKLPTMNFKPKSPPVVMLFTLWKTKDIFLKDSEKNDQEPDFILILIYLFEEFND